MIYSVDNVEYSLTKTITGFGDIPGITNTIQRIKLIIVLETKAVVLLIRSQLEGLLGYVRLRSHLLFWGK